MLFIRWFLSSPEYKTRKYSFLLFSYNRGICCVSSVGMSAEKDPLVGSCRLVLTVMVFFGVYHLMALRFNLSMALGEIFLSLFISDHLTIFQFV